MALRHPTAKLLLLLAALFLSVPGYAQPKFAVPLTAAELKEVCKSFERLQLEVDVRKPVASVELANGYACLNYIMGVLSAIGSMDVGLFPKLRYEIAESHRPIPYKDYVTSFMKCLADHPDFEKEPAAAVVALGLMQAGIVAPATWQERKGPE